MDNANNANVEIVLHEWRAKILNGFLTIATSAAIVGLAVTLIDTITHPRQWPSLVLYSILSAFLIVLVIFRKIANRIRTWGILLVAYVTGIITLATLGLSGSGRLYMLSLPIVATILLGVRPGIFMSALGAFTMAVFAFLAGYTTVLTPILHDRNSLEMAAWLAEAGDTLMLLVVNMVLLFLFYHFQESMVAREQHTHTSLEEQNAFLEKKIEERTAELLQSNKIQMAMYKIADATSTSHDIQKFYSNVHQIVGELMYARNFYIAIYDEATDLVTFPYFVDEMDAPFPPQLLKNFHGVTGYIIRSGTTTWYRNDDQVPRLEQTGEIESIGSSSEDGIGAPLKFNDKIIGVVRVQSYTPGVYYTKQDNEILAFVAQHIATALVRFRALESERQHAAELAIINSVQSGLAAEMDLLSLIDLVGNKLRETFATPNLIISQYDENANLIHYLYAYEQNERLTFPTQAPHPGGIIDRLVRAHQPVCIEYGGKRDAGVTMVLPGTHACRSGVATPIISNDKVLGVIQLEDLERENAYGESEIRLLTTIAASLGAAIEKSQLSKQRNETIEALRRSEARYRLLAENSDDVIFTLNLELDITYISPSILKLSGFPAEEVIQKKLDMLTTSESLERIMLEYSRILPLIQQGETPTSLVEAELYCRDGSKVWMEMSIKTMRGNDGSPIGYLGVSRDITARKQLEAKRQASEDALRQNEEIFHKIVNNLPQYISIWDLNMECTYVSPVVQRMTGFTPEERMAMRKEDFISQESITLLQQTLQGALINDRMPGRDPNIVVVREVEEMCKDGSQGSFESTYTFLRDAEGVPIGILAITADISERKKMEAQRDEAILALRESEEMYRLITENSDDVIWTTDTEYQLTYVSPAIQKLRGVDPTEALRETDSQVMTPESLKATVDEYKRVQDAIEQGEDITTRMEVEQYNKDGSTVWVEIARRPMRDMTGRLTGFVGVSRDISERKQVEDELQLRNTQLGMAMNMAQLAYWEFNLTQGGFSLNDQLYKLHHTTAEREGGYFMPLKVYLREFVHPDDIAHIRQRISDVRAPGSTLCDFSLDQRVICRDGDVRNHMMRVIIDRDEDGGIVKIYGINQDITERKRNEQALRESERRLTDIINFLPIATLVIDNEGRVTAWNHALEEMIGVKSEDMLGKGNYEYAMPFYGMRSPILIDLVNLPDEVLGTTYKHVKRKGNILSAEFHTTKLGENVVLLGFASQLYGADGRVYGAIESIRDITDIRQAESQLKEARDAAEAANRSKSIFLANMSHEIRTPMNAILGFIQLMKRDPDLSVRQMEYLNVITRSSEHLLALINDILELSKIEAGRATFMPGVFDLYKLLDDMEMMFRVRTDDKKLWLTMERVEDVPRWVTTDEGKLRQVLINLIGNAVKFTESGGVGVRVGVQSGQDGQNLLLFEVEDTGPGILPEEIKNLFEPFEQASSGIKMGGTGLGLALCRGYVEIMSGSISVSSEVGMGSIFRFMIPFDKGFEIPGENKEINRRVSRLEPGQGEVRILVVDDRETNRQFLTTILSLVGFTVREAVNGVEAVDIFHEWHPRIILMDVAMPVMDGYEALKLIKATLAGKDTVIIAVTATAFREDRQRIMDAGADGYLSKPFREESLFETIHQLTGLHYLYDESAAESDKVAVDKIPISREEIAALPLDLVQACQKAAGNADFFKLIDLIRSITDANSVIAKRLHDLAGKYAYEEIIDLLSMGD